MNTLPVKVRFERTESGTADYECTLSHETVVEVPTDVAAQGPAAVKAWVSKHAAVQPQHDADYIYSGWKTTVTGPISITLP